MSSLTVIDPGFLTTVQDLGRPRGEPLGLPAGGAMDRLALMAANALVGNSLGAAALEFALAGPSLRVGDCETSGALLAAAGRGFALEVGGRSVPLWMAAWARCGETVTLRSTGHGWGYLAIAGPDGIDVPEILGSRSTCLRGKFGGFQGRPLQAGDTLPLASAPAESYELAGRELPDDLIPAYSDPGGASGVLRDHPVLDVILGPQDSAFTPGAVQTFLSAEYALTPACDRMGYRLRGPVETQNLASLRPGGSEVETQDVASQAHPEKYVGARNLASLRPGGELLSEGVAFGAVQVPPDGQPIVLMADRQTTGGYPKIATVTSASLPLLAQCPAGEGTVRFRAVSVEEAQAQWRALVHSLESLG